ncbi:MAG: efflux transporter outer membrane subunit [Thermodesulfobacteriota bacterium]|nr:efflux transporter outer membrane subunit [Thermodesulfobacteriota bacterium]
MKLSKFCFSSILVVSALSFSACTMLGPDFQPPEPEMAENWTVASADFKKLSKEENIEWWKLFNDPHLDALIQTAYAQNLSLRTAGLRILESRAFLGLVKGNIYPQAQQLNGDMMTIGATDSASDRYYNAASIGFDVGWEIDFWGKFSRSIESADASLFASIADYDDVLVSLTAEVARVYTSIRTLEERIRLAKKNSKLQEDGLQLVTYQFEAGTVTELDVQQAKALLSSTLATIPNLQSVLQQTRNGLAILLGIFPEELAEFLNTAGTIPSATPQIAVGLPADLLRRRPDIRKAEMQTAAQSAQVGVALTELYPSFTLFGSLGWSANDIGDNSLGDIFDANSFSYSFGPSFKWNILNYGRIKNQVRIQDARLEQLITVYQNTVLNAAREVEDSMTALVYAQKEAEYLSQGVTSSQRSVELSLLQYEEGFVDYQRVLDSTRALTQKQDQYAQLQGQIATDFISLYKALGGGWQIRLGKDFVPQEVKETMAERTDWGNLLNNPNPEEL